jgi:predicted molibdopterin-dependent oxidoreductase YjgC
MTEVAGVPELGAIGRGEDMEITTYLEQAMTSELQGNVVDLCPVGALTSKPYAFAARPWELDKTESIDVMDAVGSAIRIDTRGREVMRILPRVNDEVNEEWISDKTRHVVDGLRAQRLDQPYIREAGRLRPASWRDAFDAIAARISSAPPQRLGAIVGDLAAVEEVYALRAVRTALRLIRSREEQPICSMPGLPESSRRMRFSSSAPIPGAKPPCSTPGSASDGSGEIFPLDLSVKTPISRTPTSISARDRRRLPMLQQAGTSLRNCSERRSTRW